MQDPAGGLPAQLLPHMHLVSRYRYPTMTALPTETVVEYLLAAPKIVREMQPMCWTFLDPPPPDGTTLLTWQPLAHLGNTFASDGYIWADAEQAFTFESRGYTVEMWVHRSGYNPPRETVATHSRRRYRLVPPKVPNPNIPNPDPSLWIVHYSRAAQSDHIPAHRIPITPQVQTMLAQRRFLQSQGQLTRKDFMLHDRNSWPTISFPPQMGPQGFAQQQPYHGNAISGRQPPGQFYPPQPGVHAGPTPTKAPRGHRASASTVASATADFALEDEEMSTGDLLDMLTPREISKIRYQQHHEWLEELFASTYNVKQIIPVDLGLGKKGELEELTAGYFEAPTTVAPPKDNQEQTTALKDGKMDPEKAQEFADKVAKRVSKVTAEIERIKKRHAIRLQKVDRLSILKDGEKRLREAGANPSETGPEVWRMEGRIDTSNEDEVTAEDFTLSIPRYKVDDVVKDLEKDYGQTISLDSNISCIEKGGLLERIEPDTKLVEDNMGPDTDMMMDTTLLDQFVASSTSTPGQGNSQVPSSTVAGPADSTQPLEQVRDTDVEMGGATDSSAQPGTAAGETGDWVVVDNEKQGNVQAPPSTDKLHPGGAPVAGETPGSGLTPGNGHSGLETSNFDDATNFTNMDSAGDALAAYDDQHDGLDLPDLENSAFGDAFHASDHELGLHPDEDEMA